MHYNVNSGKMQSKRYHGMNGSTEHMFWNNLRYKCYNPSNVNYKNWGAKGITLCDRWRNSFQNFYDDVGPRPSKKHKFEILDFTKPIGPGNGRWVGFEE